MRIVISNCRKLSDGGLRGLRWAAQGRLLPTSGVYASPAGGKSEGPGAGGNAFLAGGAARAKARRQEGARISGRRDHAEHRGRGVELELTPGTEAGSGRRAWGGWAARSRGEAGAPVGSVSQDPDETRWGSGVGAAGRGEQQLCFGVE